MELRLNRIIYPVYNLGPGQRIALWTQGCSLQCKGCISPELWTPEGGKLIEIAELAAQILSVASAFEGITLTGGEPLEQYEPVLELCRELKSASKLNIYVFTGFTLEELNAQHPRREFLEGIDYLLTGRYECTLRADENWRGSTNQVLYYIIDGKPQIVEQPNAGVWSANLSQDGTCYLSGIPRSNEMEKLINRLKDGGLSYHAESNQG